MQIWFWILAAILLTKLFLRRRIQFEHYIWMLLPIDMYGINMFSFTIKPYMLFCGIMALRILIEKRGKLYIGSGNTRIGVLLCFSALIINLLNNAQISATMAVAMVIVVLLCSLAYISNISGTYDDIPDILIATASGYGIVYIVSYAMLSIGVMLPGISALTRTDAGMFMQFNNMYAGTFVQTYRLRGFSIDPNVVIGTFAPAVAVALPQVLLRKANWRSYLSIVISLISIILTGSRMALVVLICIALLSFIVVRKEMAKSKRVKYAVVTVFVGILVLSVSLVSDVVERLVTSVSGAYANRSGFSDEYGRFSIWKESWSMLWTYNPLLGVGTGLTQDYSAHGLQTHNTWLEWVCGCGLIVGIAMVAYFFCVSIWMWREARKIRVTSVNFFASQALMLGTISVIIALVSVDNITNSYLWFLCFTGQGLLNYHNE